MPLTSPISPADLIAHARALARADPVEIAVLLGAEVERLQAALAGSGDAGAIEDLRADLAFAEARVAVLEEQGTLDAAALVTAEERIADLWLEVAAFRHVQVAPVCLAYPMIPATLVVGQVLARADVDAGLWTVKADERGVAYALRVLRDGAEVAPALPYTVKAADAGRALQVGVVATAMGHASPEVLSNAAAVGASP